MNFNRPSGAEGATDIRERFILNLNTVQFINIASQNIKAGGGNNLICSNVLWV